MGFTAQTIHLIQTLVLLSCAALLAGCGGSPRLAVTGTVTLDGVPLEEGYIQFRPLPGTPGPTAGAEIVNGRFSIAKEKGTFAGTFRVEITATRKTDQKVMDDFSGKLADVHEQFVPARYNSQTELTAQVTRQGPNRFEFPLSNR
jgi:hypothetical protein